MGPGGDGTHMSRAGFPTTQSLSSLPRNSSSPAPAPPSLGFKLAGNGNVGGNGVICADAAARDGHDSSDDSFVLQEILMRRSFSVVVLLFRSLI
ncbi:hypothetical protein EJB05_06114, partial [Eragrostis curvula]